MLLTARQKELVDYVEAETARTGKTPSIRTIARHMGFKSPSSVHKMMQVCGDRGTPARVAYFAFDDRSKSLVPFNGGSE